MNEKLKFPILVSILAVTLLTSCKNPTASNPSESEPISPAVSTAVDISWDELALKDRGANYLDAFRKGQFDGFYADASETLKSQLSQEEFTSEWSTLAATARIYSGNQTEQVEIKDGKAVVLITSVHSRYNLQTSFTFSHKDTVDAVSTKLSPLIVEPETSEKWEESPITVGYNPEKPLNGMLTLPKNVKNPPVVILVHGSGANGMDSLIGKANNRPFADLAHGLAKKGIAVIRYDKRSYVYPKDVLDVETEYLNDVKSIVQYALGEARVDATRLYLIGHSQGGMLSPIFAQENPEIKGIVSLGGTLRRLEDKVLEQTQTMMAQNEELTEEQKNAEVDRVKGEVDRIKGLTPESEDNKTELLLNYPVSYWISINAIAPDAAAKELTIPMLILQGDSDFQVTNENDYRYWQEVLGDKKNVTFQSYPGLSHVFMPGSKELFDGSSYDPPANMDTQVISDIANWIEGLQRKQ